MPAGTLVATNGGTLLVTSPLTASTYNGAGTLNGHYLVDGTSGNVATIQINPLGSGGRRGHAVG